MNPDQLSVRVRLRPIGTSGVANKGNPDRVYRTGWVGLPSAGRWTTGAIVVGHGPPRGGVMATTTTGAWRGIDSRRAPGDNRPLASTRQQPHPRIATVAATSVRRAPPGPWHARHPTGRATDGRRQGARLPNRARAHGAVDRRGRAADRPPASAVRRGRRGDPTSCRAWSWPRSPVEARAMMLNDRRRNQPPNASMAEGRGSQLDVIGSMGRAGAPVIPRFRRAVIEVWNLSSLFRRGPIVPVVARRG